MVNRNRPRLNVTLAPEIKKKIKNLAGELDLSVSRLLEFIIADFIEKYNAEKEPVDRLKKRVESFQTEDHKNEKEKQIKNILREFDTP